MTTAANSATFETRCLSSLSKVFADAPLQDEAVRSGTALWGEVFSFQVAYRSGASIRNLQAAVAGAALAPYCRLRFVGLAPSELPAFGQADAQYLRTAPGLYPDPLFAPEDESTSAPPHQWRAVWITVALPSLAEAEAVGLTAPGNPGFGLEVVLSGEDGVRLGAESFELRVVPAELPAQRLIFTEWFHCDCLATQYGVAALSEPHWELIARYAANAARHGMNMLLTPLFTPPLDTKVGGERPTVQLIGVAVGKDGGYTFDFARLERWIGMAHAAGMRYFEFSHLFTQWGAQHAPKIVATVDGEERRIFGWDTSADSAEYRAFLDAFLPELVAFIEARGLRETSYFHVSDEPRIDQLDSYRAAAALLNRHLAGFNFFEALSDYEFYEHGLVPIPVPASNHIEPFLEHGVEPLWTYYCCGQNIGVSNRFFAQPSSRNRIIGLQLYKFGIRGFLHWGYNFWYSRHSTRAIDPYRVTDADRSFPSGDSFLVYPGRNGQPVDSIRWEVFREGLQDLRALELLESLIGKTAAVELVENELGEEVTFAGCPADTARLLAIRERINGAIAEKLAADSAS